MKLGTNMIEDLKPLTRQELETHAQLMGMPCSSYAQAARVDAKLRAARQGYVRNADLHRWFLQGIR